jgi:hypothetical protein
MGIVGNIYQEYSVFNISNLYTTKVLNLSKVYCFFEQIGPYRFQIKFKCKILQVTSELNKTTYIDKDNITLF